SAEGSYVLLEVTDQGSGMTPEIQKRIFDPLFSTKGVGRGLGLSAVREIVRDHQGAIQVNSMPGQGSTFRILLPRAPGQIDSSSLPISSACSEGPASCPMRPD